VYQHPHVGCCPCFCCLVQLRSVYGDRPLLFGCRLICIPCSSPKWWLDAVVAAVGGGLSLAGSLAGVIVQARGLRCRGRACCTANVCWLLMWCGQVPGSCGAAEAALGCSSCTCRCPIMPGVAAWCSSLCANHMAQGSIPVKHSITHVHSSRMCMPTCMPVRLHCWPSLGCCCWVAVMGCSGSLCECTWLLYWQCC
jgi:hypothetical protein